MSELTLYQRQREILHAPRYSLRLAWHSPQNQSLIQGTSNHSKVAELVPLTRMHVDFIGRLNATPDWLLRFNLGMVVVGLLAPVLTPLAAVAMAWME